MTEDLMSLDIFEFEDPGTHPEPIMRLRTPWRLNATLVQDEDVVALVEQAQTAANTAQAAAEAAAAAASDAQQTADGKIETFWQDTEPATGAEGDIWFDTNDNNKVYRRTSGAWVLARDSGIAAAISAAATAQGTADGKAKVYFQTTAPTGLGAGDQGDLWVDTDDHNKLWAWTGTEFVIAQDWYAANTAAAAAQAAAEAAADVAAEALADAATAQSTADGKIESFYQTTAPTTASEGDIWFDTDDGNKVYTRRSGAWVETRDSGIAAAISSAQTAQTTADGKAKVYYQTSEPAGLGAGDAGDLWIDTDNNNKLYAWNGTAWILAQDWYAANAAAATAQAAANAAASTASTALANAATAQATADGKIDSFYQNTAPATASEGDIWFDTDDGNKAYTRRSGAWVETRDSGIAAAISSAQTAQTTADGKARVYYQAAAPTGLGAGDAGDLWVETDANNKLWAWNGTTWILAQDWYAANAAAAAAQADADTAIANAAAAQSTADTAVTNAATANAAIADIASDAKLTPVEKSAVRAEWDVIAAEKTVNDTQADAFVVSRTAYDNAFQALATYLNNGTTWSSDVPTWIADANLGTTTTIVGATFRTNWKSYYDQRTALLNAIATKAKTLADAAQTAANTAQTTANAAVKNWSQTTAPTIGSRPNAINGDRWNDTDDGNREYLAIGGAWVATSAVVPNGTTTPAAPTVSFAVAKRSLSAVITPQATLINPDGWDVQISRDNTNWYCPNLAAKADTDGWYTGALNAMLHLYEPSLALSYLPIPTSGTPALPAEAGQGYYLRVRTRCSSPAAQSAWTTSALLTVTPTLGVDFARAQVLPEILAAISKNKINSFVNADDGTSGWTLGAGVTVEVVDGLRTLKLVAPNASFVTTSFEVLPDELLEFTFGLICPNYSSLSGLFIGLTTTDTYLRYQYIFAEKRWVYQDTATNRYFVSDYKHTTRKNFKTYILGSNVDISSVPAPETTDELYVINCLKLSPGKTTAAVRSGYNATTAGTYWYLYQPQIYRVGAGKVVAANIYALTLAAIQANLGVITAGKLKSYDWVSGVAGFIVDLDAGEIHSESGGWSIFSDGTVEFNGGTIGGISFDATKLFVGTGSWGNVNTPVYLDSSGFFSLLDKIKFDPTTNTLTIKSDALETEEGGGTLNHEGRSLVWRDSAQNEQARIVYDPTVDLLKADPLGALVDFKGTWLPNTAFNAIATIDSSVQPYYIAAVAKSNGTAVCIYGKASAYNLYIRTRAVNGTWSAESTINTPTPSFSISTLALAILDDGSLYLLYTRSSDKQLFEAICDSGGTWGAHTAISGKLGYNQQLFKMANNQLRLIYVRNSDSNVVECVRSALGVWGAETSVLSGAINFKTSVFSDGRILLLYVRSSDSFLLETIRALDGTWSTPVVVRNSVTYTFHIFVYLDDTTWCMRFRTSDNNNAISIRSAAGTWGSETVTYEYETVGERRAMLLLASGKTLAIFQAITTAYLSERTDNSAFSAVPIKLEYCRAGAGIEEVGQNANGYYVKFSDGTLIGRLTTPSIGDGAVGNFTTPAEFESTDFIVVAVPKRSGAMTGGHSAYGNITSTTSYTITNEGVDTAWSGPFMVFMFGRWK